MTIPSLKTIVVPLPEETIAERIEALRVLAAGNTILAMILGLVLAMQAGQEYARRAEEKALKKLQQEEATATATKAKAESKKDR